MPYNRPGQFHYTTNGTAGTIKHGNPVISNNVPGVAVKQKAVSWKKGLAEQDLIQPGEDYGIIAKGIVEVDDVSGFAKGDAVYIVAASVTSGVTTYALTETGSGNTPYGRVVEVVGGGRGVPTGKVRIDLDKKDSVPVVA